MSRLGATHNTRLSLLTAPHVTEKGALLGSAANAYVFKVTGAADKVSIRQAIAALYKVTPIRVNTVTVPSKRVTFRGRSGRTPGYKKAIVYLRPGDKIEIA